MGFWGETSTHKGVGSNLGGVEVSRLQSYTSVPGLRDDDGGLKASEARPVLVIIVVASKHHLFKRIIHGKIPEISNFTFFFGSEV